MGLKGLKNSEKSRQRTGTAGGHGGLDTRDVSGCANNVDVLQIGARNMQNFSLLKEVGKTRKPIVLKRGMY
jgi:3-deoxy-7-phosphoheptulonate synthase